MRTARAVVVLTGNARPRAFATLKAADEQLDAVAAGAPRLSDTRFVGYNHHDGLPQGARAAVYEADYDIIDPPVTATTLANVALPLRQGHKAHGARH